MIEITFEVDGDYFSGNIVSALNNFNLIKESSWRQADGNKYQKTLTLVYGRGFTGDTDILEITLNVLGLLGETTVELIEVEVLSDGGDVEFAYGNKSVQTGIVEKPIVYSIYDLNKDGTVNNRDLSMAVARYLSGEGDDDWNSAKIADVNNDSIVDIDDFILILANYTA